MVGIFNLLRFTHTHTYIFRKQISYGHKDDWQGFVIFLSPFSN